VGGFMPYRIKKPTSKVGLVKQSHTIIIKPSHMKFNMEVMNDYLS
jgi:hypothetical protein